MGRTSRTSAMNQIFLRSALSRSSRLAMGPIRTSRAFTDPAVLAFWASLELGVSAWTLYIARACDWELGIITAISMCHLGNVFDCLLGILYELFSSGPTKASTAGMNAGIGSFSSSGFYWHFGSCKSRVTLFLTLSFPSIFMACPSIILWAISAWVWELFTLLIFQLFYTGVFHQFLLFLRLATAGTYFVLLLAFCTFRPCVFIDPDSRRAFSTLGEIGVGHIWASILAALARSCHTKSQHGLSFWIAVSHRAAPGSLFYRVKIHSFLPSFWDMLHRSVLAIR